MKKIVLLTVFFLFGTQLFAQKVAVTFQVDMGIRIAERNIDKATITVFARGSFNGWGQTEMTDVDNDSIYTVTIDTAGLAGETLSFKFFYMPGDNWEDDPNREFVVPAAGGTFFGYWNRDSVLNATGNGTVFFGVDMAPMAEIGIFDATKDSVQLRGGFNGWNDSDPARSKMIPDGSEPTYWSLDVPFVNQPFEQLDYKFYVDIADTAKSNKWTDGWERPTQTGGGNRPYVFTRDAVQVIPDHYYDDVMPGHVIPAGQNIGITFRVDMTNATNPDSVSGTPFVPGVDRVYWRSFKPSFTYSQGWLDNDTIARIELTREGITNIYSGTLNVKAPSFNGFVYLYQYVAGDSTRTLNNESSGYNLDAYRVTYIGQTADRVFVQPWIAPLDSWTNSSKAFQSEKNPLTVVSVKDDANTVVKSYSLDQNYPNPFNPSTQITFSVPEAGLVTLKVFNALGQEVSTLVNQVVNAGKNAVTFNASSLSSGVYFYTITAKNFTSTKKMMLIK